MKIVERHDPWKTITKYTSWPWPSLGHAKLGASVLDNMLRASLVWFCSRAPFSDQIGAGTRKSKGNCHRCSLVFHKCFIIFAGVSLFFICVSWFPMFFISCSWLLHVCHCVSQVFIVCSLCLMFFSF